MNLSTRIIVSLIMTGFLMQCTQHPGKLDSIDSIMESDPEKALAELDKISRGKLSASDSAYYALLYTQAMIRCDVAVSSDSLISTAYRYYADRDLTDRKTRSCFYNAKIAYNRGNMPQACRC